MSIPRQLTRGLRALLHRREADQDLADEVRDYTERAEAAYIAQGLSADAARQAARREIGNVTVMREQVRAYGWENAVEGALADLRYAARRLRRSPGFTAIAVLTLAVGIGAATAIFSAVNPILLAPLPYPHGDRLVSLADRADDGSPFPATFGTYVELAARSRSFERLAASDRWQPSLTGTAEPERLEGARVSASYFRTLGVSPAVGRDFDGTDDRVDGPKVVILSDGLLQRRFGGDRSIVGRTIMLDDDSYLVIGVMPQGFSDLEAPTARIWAPMQQRARAPFNSREWGHHYGILGRLAPHASVTSAIREIAAIGRAPDPAFPRPRWADMSNGLAVRSLRESITGRVRPALLAIAGAVLLLLAIACVNVVNLLLARGAQRQGELAMRIALGAGRGRLLRQLLTESVLLALLGGMLGLVIAEVGVRALVGISPAGLPRVDAIRLDGPVFLFALAISTLVGLLVGVVPALGASRAELRDDLQQSARHTVGGRATARRVLVVAEVALALVLLVSAGLLLRSLTRLFAVAPGFQPSHLLTMQVVEAGHGYRADSARRRFYEQALDAVRQVPGVTSAAFTSQLPLSGESDGYGYEFQAFPNVKAGDFGSAFRYAVTPDYFETMRIPLRRGRLLDVGDVPGAPEAIVLNESFARRVFGDRDPIGQRVRFGPETGSPRPWDIVVGVVGDVKQESLALGEPAAFYVPLGQWWWVDDVQSLVVRTSLDPGALVPAVKRAIWSVDSRQPILRITTMDALVAASEAQRRFALEVIETFAVAALVLAAIGLYGVLAGGVTERMRELGVRSALGATRGRILALVLGQGMALTMLGVVLGLAGAAAASGLLLSLLYGTSRLDPATYLGVVALLLGVAMVACWVPAWRAAGVDPAITLRGE